MSAFMAEEATTLGMFPGNEFEWLSSFYPPRARPPV
jgi:hypothetical protein